MIDIKRILCPVDYSAHSRRAADYACAIARWYGATVTGLHVLEPMPPLLLPGATDGLYPPVAFTREDLEQFQTQLETFMRDCAGARPVEARVVEGSVSRGDRPGRAGDPRRSHRHGDPRAIGSRSRDARIDDGEAVAQDALPAADGAGPCP